MKRHILRLFFIFFLIVFLPHRILGDNTLTGHYVFDVIISPQGDNLFTKEIGKPQLPIQRERVALPADATDIEIEVIDSQSTNEKISSPVSPVPKKIVKKDASGASYVEEEFFKDEDFYKNYKDFYPAKKAQIVEHAEMRGLHYATIEICPYRYNPNAQTLEKTTKLTLKITYQSSANTINKNLQTYGKHFEKMIRGLDLKNFSAPKVPIEISPPFQAGSINRPADLLTGAPTDYLIVTSDNFYDSLNIDSLANYRSSSPGGGYNVSIVRISDIYATAFPDKTGTETNDQLIKMFIKYVYDHWNVPNPPLEFVLLVGDAITDSNNHQLDSPVLVPTHISSYQSFGEVIATDFWYSCLGGTTPANYLSDSYDQIGDVAIGRFPIQSEDELLRIVNKTITYETVFPMVPGDWRSETGLLSGFAANQTPFLSNTTNYFTALKNAYLFPSFQSPLESDRTEQTNDNSGSLAYKETIKSHFNDGRLIVVEASHGSLTTWADGAFGQNIFQREDVGLLTNADRLPIVTTASCYTGIFDNSQFESLGEAFIENTNTGAVVYLGSSRLTDINSFELINKFVGDTLNNYLIGNAVLDARNNAWRTYRLLYNLLGDPALNISQVQQQSTKPDLTCALNSVQVVGGTATVHTTVNNIGFSDVSNVLVELYYGDPKNGGTKIDSGSGRVSIVNQQTNVAYDLIVPSWDPNFNGNLYLMVDGANEIAESSETNNTSLPLYSSMWPDLTCTLASYEISGGNVIFHSKVKNSGNTLVESVSLALYDGDPAQGGVQVPGTINPVPSVDVGQEITYDFTLPVWNSNYYGYLYLFVDNNYKISETIETNNVSQPMYTVLTQQFSTEQYLAYGTGPDIYEDKVIYYDTRNNNTDIYLYNLTTQSETRVTTNSAIQKNPRIYGNTIVYEDYRNGNADIYTYDISTSVETRLTTNTSNQTYPAIYANKVVYTDYRNSNNPDIYLYDLTAQTETRITSSTDYEQYPDIYGNKIVYSSFYSGYGKVYCYDLTTGTAQFIDSTYLPQIFPSINGDKIGYYAPVDDPNNIYVYDLTNQVRLRITHTGSILYNSAYTAVYGNQVAWIDTRSGKNELFKYDLSSQVERQLTNSQILGNKYLPHIYKKKIVYNVYGTPLFRVYLYDFNNPPILNAISNKTFNTGDNVNFVISGTDQDGDPLQLTATNLPSGAALTDNGNGTATFIWVPNQAGNYSAIHFEVSDGFGGKDSEDITITVNQSNLPPVLNPIGSKTINEGQLLTFVVSATDPNGDTLTYSASNLPPGANFDASIHAFSWTPSYSQSGSYPNVHFDVSDGQIVIGEDIAITVVDVPQKSGGGHKKIEQY